MILILVLFIIALALGALLLFRSCTPNDAQKPSETPGGFLNSIFPTATPVPTPVPTPTPEPTPTPIPDPKSAEGTRSSDFGLETEMQLDGSAIESYSRDTSLDFGDPENYTALEGVITFRGNNYRDAPAYGAAGAVKEKKLELVWEKDIPGSISKSGDGAWFGCGWTGQPLIVRWPEATRRAMNLYDEKKGKDGLVEVVYATENSFIYFLDLEDGSFTRDKIDGKWTFKGAGSLDPRGYPLLYVGAGDAGPNGPAENMIISLIDGKKLYSYGARDPFSLRGFLAFDAATLVHAAADTVTYASETGIIYQMKLNTSYDESAGTISVNPTNILKWRYTTERSREGGTGAYWLGFESSPVIWRHFMYVSDNAGDLFCIDINTMEVVWMQDVLDDTNCSPVFEIDEETGEASIYIGTSLHWTADSNDSGHIPFWRIDALTGEVVWEAKGYRVTRNANISGGIQDTAAIGKHNVADLVYVAYARTADTETRGLLVAYDKATGEERWVKDLDAYTWSSPILLYDDDGNGYVVEFDSSGKCYLFDGRSGELLDKLDLGEGNFEASPAAFDNMIVIGSRGSKIFGIKLK